MNAEAQERRRYIRIFFQTEEAIKGKLTIPGAKKKSISAGILNLSEEGVCLVIERKHLQDNGTVKIDKGDHLLLNDIIGITPEIPLSNQKMQVKWIVDNMYFDHMEIGCQMLNISDQLRSNIRQVVATRKDQQPS